jgi:CRISPR-associated endonuclease/helicase Cas3
MNAHSQALCIVNTRKHARGLFDGLEEDGRFHLSTLMCPAHRKQTLLAIRDALKNGQTCRVVSTQVMEAGIDVDFPVGYRALAGLDSIIQAAGRVNREGKNPGGGEMFVFEPESEFIKRTPAYIKQTGDVARSVLREYETDPTSIEAIIAYFKLLDKLQDPKRTSDAREILACFEKGGGFDFKTAADKFKLIENNTVSVIIPYDDKAAKHVEELRYIPYPASTLRKLQGYTVNIYEQEFQALNTKGVIEMTADAYAVLKDMSYYDAQTGIVLPAQDGGEAIFFD